MNQAAKMTENQDGGWFTHRKDVYLSLYSIYMMATHKEEILIYQPVYNIAAQFQRLCPYFCWFLYCVNQTTRIAAASQVCCVNSLEFFGDLQSYTFLKSAEFKEAENQFFFICLHLCHCHYSSHFGFLNTTAF